MTTRRSRCSIHQVVEVRPGVWQRDLTLTRSQRSTKQLTEAACPICLQMAQAVFQQQFPALYAPSMLPSRKSA